jgi:hypothetical protein
MGDTLSKEQRKDLCYDKRCNEHGEGNSRCPIPLYKEDLKSVLEESNSESSFGSAEPKTATGAVVRSDD